MRAFLLGLVLVFGLVGCACVVRNTYPAIVPGEDTPVVVACYGYTPDVPYPWHPVPCL